jgi:hypothetical protein
LWFPITIERDKTRIKKMSKSKLLKEAIADAKAVRETAIANAKIALEEAFTPRLQSILSRKLQAEMEEDELEGDEMELEEEYGAEDVSGADSSDIGAGEGDTESGTDGKQPTGGSYQDATKAHTKLDPETTKQSATVGHEDDDMPLAEGEEEFDLDEEELDLDLEEEDEFELEEDEDELDLEAIIRELEGEDDEMYEYGEDENQDGVLDDPTGATMEEEEDMEFDLEEEEDMEFDLEEEEDFDDEIDLDEILREMGYGDDEEEVYEEEEVEPAVDNTAELEAELEEAYAAIKSLRKTINEVNLLNAKLLYTNKLFRGYNLTNEQKVKVVENLDRTSSVREVKLVYATLAESMKMGGGLKKAGMKKSITEGFASKKSASTAPKKEVITESGDTIADRFKKLAGII